MNVPEAKKTDIESTVSKKRSLGNFMSGERVDVEWFQKDFYRTAKEKFNDVSLIKLLWCKMWIINMKLLPKAQTKGIYV